MVVSFSSVMSMARALLLLAMGFVVAACASVFSPHTSTPLPLQKRFDTSDLIGVRWSDTTQILEARKTFETAIPNETAVCFYGTVLDTVYSELNLLNYPYTARRKIAVIKSFEPANMALTAEDFVLYHQPACRPAHDLIGIGHTHPHPRDANEQCQQSDTDLLFLNRWSDEFWFSIAFCSNNTAHLRFVDGRSIEFLFYFNLDKRSLSH